MSKENARGMQDDAISRQVVLNEFCHSCDGWSCNPNTCCKTEWIRKLPPIQPEIIRCKDCKHWIPYDWMFSEMWQSKNIADYTEDEIGCEWSDMSMKANDFCSRAERRTE